MLERKYQAELIKTLRKMFPGCYILKLDPGYLQGVPDLLILYRDRWAVLEVKKDAKAPERPNQGYHVQTMNNMSFAAFIYPSIEEAVLSDLQRSFETCGDARIS